MDNAGDVLAYLGLGSNIGRRCRNLRRAVEKLEAVNALTVRRRSPVYESPPWGVTDQPRFLNAVIEIATGLPPRELLAATSGIEDELGRRRLRRWGPRLIDIDILLYGDRVVNLPSLSIPHPHLRERAFVLRPLKALVPDRRLPGGPTVLEAFNALDPEETEALAFRGQFSDCSEEGGTDGATSESGE